MKLCPGHTRGPLALLVLLVLSTDAAAAQPSSTDQTSRNWSGYIAGDAYYSGVSALIQTPVASGYQPRGRSAIASWVGIGGATAPDLIQAGVEVDVNASGTVYDAWYEMLPQSSRTTTLTISAGHWVQVDIREVDVDLWQISIVDGQQVFQIDVPYTSSHSSAEWIVEDPSLARGLLPLAFVTGTNFANMAAVANGETTRAAQLAPLPVFLVAGGGQTVASPSALGGDGQSFNVLTPAGS
jgi:peptidase A4-like protein